MLEISLARASFYLSPLCMDVPVSLGTCLCVHVCLGVCVLTEVQMRGHTGACVCSCM